MRPRSRIFILLGLIALAVVVSLIVKPSAEPYYQGRSLSQWLAIHADRWDRQPETDGFDSRAAILAIGTNALPTLLAWIDYEDALAAMADKLPAGIRRNPTANNLLYRRNPRSDLAVLAIEGFAVLGSRADPARPALVRLMTDTNRLDTSLRAIEALAHLGPFAVPELLSALTNRTSPNRGAIAFVFRNIPELGTNTFQVTTILSNCLSDPDFEVGVAAKGSLRELATRSSEPTSSANAFPSRVQ